MYYPYLRARQNELIAVRDLSSEDNFKNYVTPVLEPINAKLNSLKGLRHAVTRLLFIIQIMLSIYWIVFGNMHSMM